MKDGGGERSVGAAIGATGDFLERAQELVRFKVDVLAIDSAHGHSSRVLEAIRTVKKQFPEVDLIAGSVTDSRMGEEYVEREFKVPAGNVRRDGAKLFEIIKQKVSALGLSSGKDFTTQITEIEVSEARP